MSETGRPRPAGSRADAVSATSAVLGRGSVYTLATAAPALATLAVIPVVTRLLGRDEYDLVAVASVVVQVGYILMALGLGAAITRQYILAAAGPAGARGLVLQGAGLSLGLAVVVTGTSRWWVPAVLGRVVSVEIVLALIACLGGAWMVLAQAHLRGADRALSFVVLSATASLVGPAGGLLAVTIGERTAAVYLSGLAAGFLAAGVLGLLLVVGSGQVAGRGAELRAALRIGLPTVPHQVSLYLALAGMVVVADRVLGDGGRANVALTIGAGATVVTAGLNNAWAPVVYRTAPNERGRVLDETTRAVARVTMVVAGTIALLAPWLLQVAAPDSFEPVGLVPAVAVASAAAVPSVVYLACGHLIFASGNTGWLALTTPLAVVGGLVWAALLAQAWGMVAVASGYLVAYLLLTTATTAVQRRVSPQPWWPPLMPGVAIAWAGTTVLGALLPTSGPGAVVRLVAVGVLVIGLGSTRVVRRRQAAMGDRRSGWGPARVRRVGSG